MLFFRATSSGHDVMPPGEPSVNSLQGTVLNYLNYKGCKIAPTVGRNRTHNDLIHGRERRPVSQRTMRLTPRPDARRLRLPTPVSTSDLCILDFRAEVMYPTRLALH